MRIVRSLSILACSVLACSASVLPAQGVAGGMVAGNGIAQPHDDRSKLSHTMTWTSRSVQTLADGTTITHETTMREARDSSGRIYIETRNSLPAGEDGQPREYVHYQVIDPVAHTNSLWDSNSKMASVFHEPSRAADPVQIVPPPLPVPLAEAAQKVERLHPSEQREDLGTRVILGVTARGVRTTRVYPEGSEGNDRPLTTIDEGWRSTEYGVVLSSIHDDPRRGTITRETTEFKPGEPDAELFHVPAGYEVRDKTRPAPGGPLQ